MSAPAPAIDRTLGMTLGACGLCRAVVPAKIITDGADVYLRTFCREHGEKQSLVRRGLQEWISAQRYVKPAWIPRAFSGDASRGCPDGCGFCPRHEQHLCLPVIEITSRCDLACPICIADAGCSWDMNREELARILERHGEAEAQVDVLNFSGGEPLLHPQLLQMVDDALARPFIVRVSISTNGLGLLDKKPLLEELHKRNAVISLQLDGFDDNAYRLMRGRPLADQKRRILDLLGEVGISTSLTVTHASGVNDGEMRGILDLLFGRDHIVSITVQPLSFAGRGAQFEGKLARTTLPDTVAALSKSGHPAVSAKDFVPLPCSHPLCFTLAYYLIANDGRAISVNQVAEAATVLDCIANRAFFGTSAEDADRLKAILYDLWSGPAATAPDTAAVLASIRDLLRKVSCATCFDPRRVSALAERKVKSIFIHAFMDAEDFDLARARRCCTSYPQPDGRFMPACTFNVFHRKERLSKSQ
jgi:uncharacterized radical SAM superfamily Fe-S cluster-containing enzyme